MLNSWVSSFNKKSKILFNRTNISFHFLFYGICGWLSFENSYTVHTNHIKIFFFFFISIILKIVSYFFDQATPHGIGNAILMLLFRYFFFIFLGKISEITRKKGIISHQAPLFIFLHNHLRHVFGIKCCHQCHFSCWKFTTFHAFTRWLNKISLFWIQLLLFFLPNWSFLKSLIECHVCNTQA